MPHGQDGRFAKKDHLSERQNPQSVPPPWGSLPNVSVCARQGSRSQLHLYRKIIISIIVWQWDTVTRRKSSSGFDFTKPCKICDTKFASKGKPKLNHFYTKVISAVY